MWILGLSRCAHPIGVQRRVRFDEHHGFRCVRGSVRLETMGESALTDRRVRVLVVEDAADVREELVDYLSFHGFECGGAESVSAMREQLERGPWDVLVLDLGLPDGDGLTEARRLRSHRGLDLGIVMVTARGQTDDRIAGLDAGADTYLVKPVHPGELRAVIDRLASRLRGAAGAETEQHAVWCLSKSPLALNCPDGQSVSLTGAEARLLDCLVEARGEPVERAALCKRINPRSAPLETRHLDSMLSRLRSKVERESGRPLPVQTYRNLGYCFSERCEREG